MKILAGIFYLLTFIGIMAVAHFIPSSPPAPAKPTAAVESEAAPEPEIEEVPIEEIIAETLRSELKNTNVEFKQLRGLITSNSEEMANLNRRFDQIADTNISLKKENSLLAKRIAEIEARPVFTKPEIEVETEPEAPEIAPEPAVVPPPSPPTPRGKSVNFELGSMDFSESALATLKKAADEMALNEKVVVSLQGNTSGFGTSLGTGRAAAVKSKLAEFGVAAERVTVSEQSGTSSDSVQLSFRKK